MQIKIKCTAAEFGALVRACERGRVNNYCSGCALGEVCSAAAECADECRVEHFVSFELAEGGCDG